MNKRKLGDTGLLVSEIGFGGWQLGRGEDWTPVEEGEGIKLVHKALDLGCNFFDTAPNYGGGQSQIIMGKALKGRRDKVVINTKFGHHRDKSTDYSPSRLRPTVEESLTDLQTDYLDSLLLHNPPEEFLTGSHPIYHELDKLVKEGKIRYYGASIDSSREIFEVIKTTKSKVLEVLYNIFSQETGFAFAEANERGVGLIIKVPLDSGWLSGKYNKDSVFQGTRSRWSREVIERRAGLIDKIRLIIGNNIPMAQAALQFVLARPEVSTVIPGLLKEEQLQNNFSAGEKALSGQVVKELHSFWEKELKENPLPW